VNRASGRVNAIHRHAAFPSSPERSRLVGHGLPVSDSELCRAKAIVLYDASTANNIFYRLCPEPLLILFVVLATIATIIASQPITTGAFSTTRPAIQLGWLPRLQITRKIYVGVINWLLSIVAVGPRLFFGKSDNVAAARHSWRCLLHSLQ
jgi:K+ potassium transporter